MIKMLNLLGSLLLLAALTACSAAGAADNSNSSASLADQTGQTASGNGGLSAGTFDLDDLDASAGGSSITSISLLGDSIGISGTGAKAEGCVLTINAAGSYSLSGSLDDGQIRVNAGGGEKVKLILNGAEINCSSSSAIYIMNSSKTVITLAEGTLNSVADGDSYSFKDDSDEPDAAIFSKTDLTINGGGTLNLRANYNHGIVSKDTLKITGGDLNIEAVNDGLRGRDCIIIKAGSIKVKAGGDGLQSNNDEDNSKGFINILSGDLVIASVNDGLQAETDLLISGGEITVISGGGSAQAVSKNSQRPAGNKSLTNSADGAATTTSGATASKTPAVAAVSVETSSSKALKAGRDISIAGGTLNLNSADDAINANNSFTLSDGSIFLASGDDGLHADSAITCLGGEIEITKSYEGFESPLVTIYDARIHITASDDGINVTGGAGSQEMMGGRPGQAMGMESSTANTNHLYIHGGYLYVIAGGDGIDVNGSIDMSGGVVIVNGPTNNGNGPLDYYNTFNITGGYLLAVGSAGMAQSVSQTSTQYTVMLNLNSALTADTLLHFATAEGEEILTFRPVKAYQSIVFSSADLKNGQSLVFYSGGSATGSALDGLYANAEYTPGDQVGNLTIAAVVSSSGTGSAMGPGGMGGGGLMPAGGQQGNRSGTRPTVTPPAAP